MALAKQCDRCGKYYKHYPNYNGMSFESISTVGAVKSSNTKDLCPDCMEQLKQWFDNGKEHDGTDS